MGVSAGDIRARARVLLEETFPLETLQWVVQATLTHLWWGVSSGRLCRSDHKCFTNWQSWWDSPPCPALPVSLSNQFPYWRHTERATVVLSVSVIVNWVKILGGGAGEGCTVWPGQQELRWVVRELGMSALPTSNTGLVDIIINSFSSLSQLCNE